MRESPSSFNFIRVRVFMVGMLLILSGADLVRAGSEEEPAAKPDKETTERSSGRGVGKPESAMDPEVRTTNAIRKLSQDLAVRSKALVVDGAAQDWKAFPWQRALMEPLPDGHAEAVKLAIAPFEHTLGFCLLPEVEGSSSLRKWKEVHLRIIVPGSREGEQVVIVIRPGTAFLYEYKRDHLIRHIPVRGAVQVSFGDIIEGRINLAKVPAGIDGSCLGNAFDPSRSKWIRVESALATAYPDNATDAEIYESSLRMGPAAASYLLCTEKESARWFGGCPDIDEMKPIDFLMSGKWVVVQSAHGWATHEGKFAYDLGILDARGLGYRGKLAFRAGERTALVDFYAWGAEVVSPVSGQVRSAIDKWPDHGVLAPEEQNETGLGMKSNMVSVRTSQGYQMTFAHLQEGSLRFRSGEWVQAGEVLGRVGNSGKSGGPHLHLDVLDVSRNVTVPLVLKDVVVGLNSGDEDPWEIEFGAWKMDAWCFVRAKK